MEAGPMHVHMRGTFHDASRGDLAGMMLAFEISETWDEHTTTGAAMSGSLACMRFAHENGAPWHHDTTLFAAKGHLDCLRYAHENGANWHEWTMLEAARDLDCMKYAHQNGAPWHPLVPSISAFDGALDCLKYAQHLGLGWQEHVVVLSAERLRRYPESERHEAFLRHLLREKYPYNPYTTRTQNSRAQILAVMAQARSARTIQRHWFVWRAKQHQKRVDAVSTIQDAYQKWASRPVSGSWYKRARLSFLQL